MLPKEEMRKKQEYRIPGLCHGVFGVSTIFNYMYQETKESIFKETSDFRMEESLKMDTYKDGYTGYEQWRDDFGTLVCSAIRKSMERMFND